MSLSGPKDFLQQFYRAGNLAITVIREYRSDQVAMQCLPLVMLNVRMDATIAKDG